MSTNVREGFWFENKYYYFDRKINLVGKAGFICIKDGRLKKGENRTAIFGLTKDGELYLIAD